MSEQKEIEQKTASENGNTGNTIVININVNVNSCSNDEKDDEETKKLYKKFYRGNSL